MEEPSAKLLFSTLTLSLVRAKHRKKRTAHRRATILTTKVHCMGAASPTPLTILEVPSGSTLVVPMMLFSKSQNIPMAMKLPIYAKNILNDEKTDFSRLSSVTAPSIAP